VQVREIEGKFIINFFQGRQELVKKIRSFEKSTKANPRETCLGLKNQGFEKAGFHCKNRPDLKTFVYDQ